MQVAIHGRFVIVFVHRRPAFQVCNVLLLELDNLHANSRLTESQHLYQGLEGSPSSSRPVMSTLASAHCNLHPNPCKGVEQPSGCLPE